MDSLWWGGRAPWGRWQRSESSQMMAGAGGEGVVFEASNTVQLSAVFAAPQVAGCPWRGARKLEGLEGLEG